MMAQQAEQEAVLPAVPTLRVGARVGVYRKRDGRLNEADPVVTIIGRRGAYLTTSQGSLLDPKTGVFFGGVFVAGPVCDDLAE